jgi:hypothetical protein
VREDPVRAGLLYAGTEFGMYVSFDNGAHWQPFHLNMPVVPINDIRVHRGDLVVATQGRAAWILDNIASLQQLAPSTASAPLTVFRPRDGYRSNVASTLVSPTVEYYLPAAATDTVHIEVLDAMGAVVNLYRSGVRPMAAAGRGRAPAGDDPDESMMEGRGGRAAALAAGPAADAVGTAAGLNRFVWGMRDQQGIGAPPGRYTVRVVMGKTAAEVPLRVRIDPRLAADGTTEADLQAQYRHNVAMRSMVQEVNAAVARVRAAQQRLGAAGGADTVARLTKVAAVLNTQPIRYGKPGLQAHISYLAGMTARVDQKVGRDAIQRRAFLRAELDKVQRELTALLGPSAP